MIVLNILGYFGLNKQNSYAALNDHLLQSILWISEAFYLVLNRLKIVLYIHGTSKDKQGLKKQTRI